MPYPSVPYYHLLAHRASFHWCQYLSGQHFQVLAVVPLSLLVLGSYALPVKAILVPNPSSSPGLSLPESGLAQPPLTPDSSKGALARGALSPIAVSQSVTLRSPQLAQTAPLPDRTPPSLEPPEEVEPLPPADPADLLGPDFRPLPPDASPLPGDGRTVTVQQFEVVGSTVFSEADFARITADYVNRPLTFEDLQALRDEITELYRQNDYITSGAIIPPQPLQDGTLRIQVIEGRVEEIVVAGTRRLKPAYISSRLNLGTTPPLQLPRLLEQLQLLQLDPLIDRLSADLQAGTRPGTNILVVSVVEADSFGVQYQLDNNRSPSVGSVRHQISATERNLTGFGDTLNVGYTLTNGSSELDALYVLPVSPHNTTVSLSLGNTDSDVIEAPFDVLEINSQADVVELTLRHPLIQTPTQELALGLVASRQETQTSLGIGDIGGFPLSAGASDDGVTAVTALRFFQEWTQRSTEQVFAVRSQFSLGLGAFGATVNDEPEVPDSQFIAWLGQGQWVRRLGPDTLLVAKGSMQLTPDPLLSLEQIGLGGQTTVRGYRQDAILTDNGLSLSLEARFPVWRDLENKALLQITPFIEGGYGWNNEVADPDPNTLVSIGTGLLLRVENRLTFRLDWGIPLTERRGERNTLQEQGVYFSFNYSFF